MAFDEMSGDTPGYGGGVRDSYRGLARWLADAPEGLLQARSRQAELFFRRMGITFAVYGDAESSERLIPFDVVPRIIGASEWAGLEAGLTQRVRAINLFLADVYGPQECLKAGVLPADSGRNASMRSSNLLFRVGACFIFKPGIKTIRLIF